MPSLAEQIRQRITPQMVTNRQMSPEQMGGGDRLAYLAQQQPRNALEGELGLFSNPDGSRSSEKSVTVNLGGRWVNIPMLVSGQSREAILRILDGDITDDDIRLAVERAMQRQAMGYELPSYDTVEEAEAYAVQRSAGKGY